MTAVTTPTNDPAIALPVRALLTVVVAASAGTGFAWAAGALLLGHDRAAAAAGVAAASVVAVCTVAGVLVMSPWRTRPVSQWITFWLAQTVLRLLITPVVTYLLYSAASFRAMPLFLAVGITYMVAVLSEAGVLARHMRRFGTP